MRSRSRSRCAGQTADRYNGHNKKVCSSEKVLSHTRCGEIACDRADRCRTTRLGTFGTQTHLDRCSQAQQFGERQFEGRSCDHSLVSRS